MCHNTGWGDSAAEKIKIVPNADFFLHAPPYVAIDAGFFGQKNIEVAIVNPGDDEKSLAAVLNGNIQFSTGDPILVPIAAQLGQNGFVLAHVKGVPFWDV